MSYIIAYSANKDEGKSTTLNILVNLLTEIADFVEIYRESDVDTCAWFRINDKYIYVGTEGDEVKTVKMNIKFTEKYDCYIGVVASRKTGDTAVVIKNLKNAKMILKNDLESKLPKKMNNNSKNRIIAAKLFHEILNLLLLEYNTKEEKKFMI